MLDFGTSCRLILVPKLTCCYLLLQIVENIGFITEVRSLILQLGCVPGALLSENYATKDSAEKVGVPVSSVDPSGNYKVANSSSLMVDNSNQESKSSQASRFVGQLSHHQMREVQNKTCQPSHQSQRLPKSHNDHRQQKATPMMKPSFSFNGQLDKGVRGAEVIPSNSNAWLSQQTSLLNSRSGLNCQPPGQFGGSHSCQNSMEQQILSGSGVQGHLGKNSSALDTFNMSQLRTSKGLILDPHMGSVTTLSEESKLKGAINNHLRPDSVPCSLPYLHRAADSNSSGPLLADIQLQYAGSSKPAGVHFPSQAVEFTTGHMLSGEEDHTHMSPVVNHNQNELAPREQKIDSDFFQGLEIPYINSDKPMSLSEQIPGLFSDSQNYDIGNQTPSINGKQEYACALPPSGDDLFDILGVEFKTKLLDDTWNNLLANGREAKLENLGENSSSLRDMQDVGPDLYSVSEGMSESGIFSGMGSDHLLDAVVSRAHSASKQRSDDVSCRTALTKISSSSVPSSSAAYGRLNMSDHVEGEFFGLPKPLRKMSTGETSSLMSGCSKDDTGNVSQTTSIYGSHISSWVEQGNNVKHDSSVSTAYSKKPDEINKSNRKRLKPGENPRPRPKDRQMIQDRVKELREIVPNGAKVTFLSPFLLCNSPLLLVFLFAQNSKLMLES